jgi:hypothetical protein
VDLRRRIRDGRDDEMVRHRAVSAPPRGERESRDPRKEPRETPENRAEGDDAPDDERTGEPFSSPCSMELGIGEAFVPPEKESDA